MATRRRTVAKSTSVERNIATALEKLNAARRDGDRAVATRSRTSRKLSVESRRLNRRRGTLLRRKAAADKRARATPSVATRKALREAVSELAATRKALAKVRTAKAINSPELAALRAALRQADAYSKAIAQADKVLNKPTKRKRKSA